MAFFLGKVARDLSSGALSESKVENADGKHFVFNADNGKALGFWGDSEVRCADVTSSSEGMNMRVRLSDGKNAMIETSSRCLRTQTARILSGELPAIYWCLL